MNIINFFKSLVESFNPPHTGVSRADSPDEPTAAEHSEFVGAPQVTWTQKSSYKKYPGRDQDGSLSCVLQSTAKARGATYANQGGNFPILSALPYNKRSNFPGAGTIPFEGLQLTVAGLPLESLYPSQKMSEAQMNGAPKPPADPVYGGGVPVRLPIDDIDAIAQAIDLGYGVVLCNNFATMEYQYIPITVKGIIRAVDHQIAGIDRTILGSSKAIVCDDSAFLGTSVNGQRIITEEWLINHCFFAGYVRNVTPPKAQAIPKPVHVFTTDLSLGMTSNEVLLMQQRLIFEGYLSSDCATGYFGPLSKKALIAYQTAKNLPPTGFCGPMTRQAFNS